MGNRGRESDANVHIQGMHLCNGNYGRLREEAVVNLQPFRLFADQSALSTQHQSPRQYSPFSNDLSC